MRRFPRPGESRLTGAPDAPGRLSPMHRVESGTLPVAGELVERGFDVRPFSHEASVDGEPKVSCLRNSSQRPACEVVVSTDGWNHRDIHAFARLKQRITPRLAAASRVPPGLPQIREAVDGNWSKTPSAWGPSGPAGASPGKEPRRVFAQVSAYIVAQEHQGARGVGPFKGSQVQILSARPKNRL